MWGGGPTWLAPVRAMRNLFGRYGITGGQIRGLYSGIVPVAVVDRYRDDSEGSLYGMTMVNVTGVLQYPAFAMGSGVDDWEVLALNCGGYFPSPMGFDDWLVPFVYSPDSTYLPVVTVNPLGFYEPGLVTNWSYTLGSVQGLCGSNPTLPPRIGFYPTGTYQTRLDVGTSTQGNAFAFDPPLRVYRDTTLGIILDIALTGTTPSFFVSVLYRIRPRTTDGPRTGA